MNVDDILGARLPSLAERAKEASAAKAAAVAQEREERYRELLGETQAFMENVLRCTEAELEDATVVRGPDENDLPVVLITMPGGLKLRAHIVKKKVQISSVRGDEIVEEVTEFQAKRPAVAAQWNAPWNKIESLEDLGDLL